MSQNYNEASGQEQEQLPSDSACSSAPESISDQEGNNLVFDFLYHDADRIGSFLSQFGNFGHLQQIKKTESTGSSSSNKANIGAEGAVPFLTKMKGGGERSWGKDGREGAERVYNPLWANARALLDHLNDQGMIYRDIHDARIGDFVLESGSLGVVDLSMFKGIWENPIFRKAMMSGAIPDESQNKNRQPRRSPGKNNSTATQAQREAELVFEFIPLMPHTVQMQLLTNSHKHIWANLRENCMITSSSEILLKHGLFISGKWNVLGILDALPEEPNNEDTMDVDKLQDDFSRDNPLSVLYRTIAPIIRQFGRHSNSYGITPLLVFREVSPVR